MQSRVLQPYKNSVNIVFDSSYFESEMQAVTAVNIFVAIFYVLNLKVWPRILSFLITLTLYQNFILSTRHNTFLFFNAILYTSYICLKMLLAFIFLMKLVEYLVRVSLLSINS